MRSVNIVNSGNAKAQILPFVVDLLYRYNKCTTNGSDGVGAKGRNVKYTKFEEQHELSWDV